MADSANFSRRRTGGDSSKASDALLSILLAVDAPPERRKQFTEFVASLGGDLKGQRLVSALCLVTAMPEYQLC